MPSKPKDTAPAHVGAPLKNKNASKPARQRATCVLPVIRVTAAQLKQVRADATKAKKPLSKYVREKLGL
jgi:hypothetical protein